MVTLIDFHLVWLENKICCKKYSNSSNLPNYITFNRKIFFKMQREIHYYPHPHRRGNDTIRASNVCVFKQMFRTHKQK